jgi:hypothetical protein
MESHTHGQDDIISQFFLKNTDRGLNNGVQTAPKYFQNKVSEESTTPTDNFIISKDQGPFSLNINVFLTMIC